jgi:hypothetical protein
MQLKSKSKMETGNAVLFSLACVCCLLLTSCAIIRGYRVDKAQYPGYYAHGIRGLVLYVNPYKRLIMVRMGKQDNTFASIPYVFEQLSNCGF